MGNFCPESRRAADDSNLCRGGYVQCGLKKGDIEQTAYIPANLASISQKVCIGSSDVLECGWVVQWVGHYIERPVWSVQAIRNHRTATGDSLPKQKSRRGRSG